MTHFCQQFSPEQYSEFKDFVFKEINKYDADTVQSLAVDKINEYKEKGVTLSEEDALDEVVADACIKMLEDGSALKKLAQSNLSTKDKIIAEIRNLIDNLLKMFEARDVNTREYHALLDAKADLEKLQAMWNGMLTDAAESFNATNGNESTKTMYSTKSDVLAISGIDWADDNSSIKEQLIKHSSEINNMQPVCAVTFVPNSKTPIATTILDVVKQIGGKNIKNNNITFEFEEKGINKILAHAKSYELKAAALSSPYVAKYGKLIAGQKNHEGTGLTTLTFAAPAFINGEKVNVGVAIQFQSNGKPRAVNVELQSGNKFVIDIKRASVGQGDSRVERYVQGTSLPTTDANNSILQSSEESQGKNSVKTDSDGRTLSEGQQEYFKDSKVRDENGRLLKLYHGSREVFTIFRPYDGKSQFGKYKFGSHNVNYFTTSKSAAEDFSRDNDTGMLGNVMEGYVLAKKPFNFVDENDMVNDRGYSTANGLKNRELREFQLHLFDKRLKLLRVADSVEEANELLMPFNAHIEDFGEDDSGDRYELFTNGGNFMFSRESFVTSANDLWDMFYDDVDLLKKEVLGVSDEYGDDDYYFTTDQIVNLVFAMNDENGTGYDAIIIDNILDGKAFSSMPGTDVITLKGSYQFKNADNTNPTENEDIRYSVKTKSKYDFSKSFSEQIADYEKGLFPEYDTLVLGKTPEVYQKIGLSPLPVTFGTGHLEDLLHPKDDDHTFTRAQIENLPKYLENPIAIIESRSPNAKKNSIVTVLDTSHNGKQSIAAVVVEGFGKIHRERIDSNAITTFHSRENTVTGLLSDAVSNELNGSGGIFYWDKKKAIQLLSVSGVQFPGSAGLSDGSIRSISDPLSKVNPKIKNITETKQFKKWFGDWQNHPEDINPALLNEDGTPKVFYHGAKKNGGFTVFRDWQYFTENKQYAERYAERGNNKSLYPVYLTMDNPFDTRKPECAKIFEQMRQEYGLSELQENGLPDWTDGYDIAEFIEENDLDFDGIILDEGGDLVNGEPISRGVSYVIRKSTQIKSATDNIGTYDGNNSDFNYSVKTEGLSSREILANAFDDVAQTPGEKEALERYRSRIESLNADQEKLAELRKQIKDISFTKGSDRSKLTKLTNQANVLADRISRADKELLKFENSKALKDVLEREKANLTKRMKQKSRERLADYREDRKVTLMRNKIKSLHGKINTMLNNPTDGSYIPKGLISAAICA